MKWYDSVKTVKNILKALAITLVWSGLYVARIGSKKRIQNTNATSNAKKQPSV